MWCSYGAGHGRGEWVRAWARGIGAGHGTGHGAGHGAGHGIMLGDRGQGVEARGSMVMGETWDGASHRRGGMGRIGFGGMGQVGLPALCSGTCSGAGTG